MLKFDILFLVYMLLFYAQLEAKLHNVLLYKYHDLPLPESQVNNYNRPKQVITHLKHLV